mmetsp:Transcript_1039/g.1469  ORF Transcript_1039/g.1469 Transcript_1039/m.1469 type:complete len:154 (+) Transcript_1039:98-559(+)
MRKLLASQKKKLLRNTDDAVKIFDVRNLGAPVKHYIVPVRNLVVNGKSIKSELPILAMVDTGTTGLYISDKLFYKILPESKGFRSCEINIPTEQGNLATLTASRPDPHFLVFPVSFPWLNESKAHMIVVGLAFLDKKQVTFDLDEGRIAFDDQ